MKLKYDPKCDLEIDARQIQASDRNHIVDSYWQLHPRVTFVKKVPRGGRLLDVGAGSGGLAGVRNLYNPLRNDIHMYAVDLQCGEHFDSYEDYQICNMDTDELKFSDDFFDSIIGSHVFEHLIDPHKFLQVCLRVMKPGTLMYLEFPSPHTVDLPHCDVLQKQGLPATASSFFEDNTHFRTHDPFDVCALARIVGFRPLEAGVVNNKYLEDDLIAYAHQYKDAELAAYGLWAKMQWASYVVLQKPDTLTNYIESRDRNKTRADYEKDPSLSG